MNNEYYKAMGIIYETFEEGYISEGTKNGLINKIKYHLGPSKKEIRKTHNERLAAENRYKILSNLNDAFTSDLEDDRNEARRRRTDDLVEQRYIRSVINKIKTNKLRGNALHKKVSSSLADDFNKDLNPKKYKKALKKK